MDKTTLEKTTPGGKSANQLVNPPPSGTGPMDSGGSQTLLDGGEEKERTENALQKGPDGEDPFKRINLLHRSPTRTQRTLSLDRTGSSTGRKKRKAEQSPPKTGSSERERETLWLRLVSKVGKLRTLVIANPTTKVEIKKNSEELQSLVTVLSTWKRQVTMKILPKDYKPKIKLFLAAWVHKRRKTILLHSGHTN